MLKTSDQPVRRATSQIARGFSSLSVLGIALALTWVMTQPLKGFKALSVTATKTIDYMTITFTVPSNWAEFRGTGMLVIEPLATVGAKTSTAVTLEAFKGTKAASPAIDHYYNGPWTVGRSHYGLTMKVGTRIRVLHDGQHTLLATEYVDIETANLGIGISGSGPTVDSALASGRSVLLTARRSA